MLKTDRFREREDQLAQALEVNAVEALWQRYVRNNLRKQPIKDLHDYYDFHLNRRERISITVSSILNGVYQPRQALRLRSEKGNGIARQLVFPGPEDALILEALCEHLSSTIRECQPSQNAFYSRNLPQPRSVKEIDETFGYAWWELWPEFQNRILNFAQNHAFLTVTDVANYYDSIDFTQLRNYIASLEHFSEVYLDFLFFTIERFVWRPDYLPYPGRGLPQIQLDAPRLLAHAFLFEVDRCLIQTTQDQFVRWMDDIDFGCNSREQAKSILQKIDDLLLSRGLHLNSSKTKILSGEEACAHFQLEENRFLNVFNNRLSRLLEEDRFHRKRERKRLRKRFKDFITQDSVGQWNKVLKRYLILFGKLEDPYLEGLAIEWLHEQPSLRSNIFRYFIQIGWTETREQILIEFIQETVDDDSFFGAIDVLLAWNPTSTVRYVIRMRNLAEQLRQTTPIGFLAGLWLTAKFGCSQDVDTLVREQRDTWKDNSWLARQVACLWPRMNVPATKHMFRSTVQKFGLSEASLVLDNYAWISTNSNDFRHRVRPYVQAVNRKGFYPVPKLLIAISAFSGNLSSREISPVKQALLEQLTCSITKFRIKSAANEHRVCLPFMRRVA